MAEVHLKRFDIGELEPLTGYANSIGLESEPPEKLIGVIKAGLPASSFERLQALLGVSQEALAETVGISPRTLSRRLKAGRFRPDESERIYRIARLFDRAKEVLGGEANARRWLQTPRPYLGGATPLSYADTEPGAQVVERLLGRIEYGVYS